MAGFIPSYFILLLFGVIVNGIFHPLAQFLSQQFDVGIHKGYSVLRSDTNTLQACWTCSQWELKCSWHLEIRVLLEANPCWLGTSFTNSFPCFTSTCARCLLDYVELFSLIQSHFRCFFCCLSFGIILKMYCQNLCFFWFWKTWSQYVVHTDSKLVLFLSQSLMCWYFSHEILILQFPGALVLYFLVRILQMLTFRPLVHFGLFFVGRIKCWSNFIPSSVQIRYSVCLATFCK